VQRWRTNCQISLPIHQTLVAAVEVLFPSVADLYSSNLGNGLGCRYERQRKEIKRLVGRAGVTGLLLKIREGRMRSGF
jgi:hypothetical protein